jgi:hypothetical protein
MVASASPLLAQVTPQRVDLTPPVQVVTAGQLAPVAIVYNSDDVTVTGVGVRVFYDSLKLTLESQSGLYSNASVGAGEAEDSFNEDGDTETDRVYTAGWADIHGEWPGEEVVLPLTLVTLNFRTRPGYLSAGFNVTGSACGECALQLGDALIQVIGGGPTFTPTATPSITGTPTPLPTPTFGPSPTSGGPSSPPGGAPPLPTVPSAVAAIPAASASKLFVLTVLLGAIALVALTRRG